MADINLSAIAAGSGGFVINGECAYDRSGGSVADAGDVNGDGFTDLIVGAPSATVYSSGRSYVVFGHGGSLVVDLSAVAAGTGGFVINDRRFGESSGRSVASAGDVNGDGLAGDRIDLSTIDANGSSAGNGRFTFIGTAAFSGNSRGKLRFDADSHRLLGSTDSDTAAEFSILLPNLNSMVAADFIL